jgi:hypothetical protein
MCQSFQPSFLSAGNLETGNWKIEIGKWKGEEREE